MQNQRSATSSKTKPNQIKPNQTERKQTLHPRRYDMRTYRNYSAPFRFLHSRLQSKVTYITETITIHETNS